MKKRNCAFDELLPLFMAAFLFCYLCTGIGAGEVSLNKAIEQSATDIAEQIPAKSRVAIVAFESPNDNLSEYIMEELTGALFDRGIEVADRRNLEYVYKELNFQMSGNVSEKESQSIGKFLAAQLVITGQLISQGGTYRYRSSAIHVETAVRASFTRLDVQNDRTMRSLVTAMAKQKTTSRTAKYGVNEKTMPQTPGTFLDRGIMFAMRGDYELAIADFSDAIKLNPNLSTTYMLRGRALCASVSRVWSVEDNFSGFSAPTTGGQTTVEQKRIYEQAIADYTQAIRLDPNDASAYRSRGMAYSDKGDHDRAIADINQAIRLDPNATAAYNARAVVYNSKGDYDRAIADYTQAIRLDPNDAIAYYNRGLAYSNKKDYDRVIADTNQAVRLDPNFPDAYILRGVTYAGKSDYDRAIADFNQAIRLDPNNPNNAVAYTARGIVYANKGDYNRAIADFEAALQIEPSNAMYRDNLKIARQARGW